ncbi:hypothetical protein LTR62_008042 [Meristemomyces frigidus]|uniref:Anaphase-promoting complex subunit 4 n=1 Tax=Meristemomyces frigidus TaxID=1508187 RepID=A0AAN7TM81_9PEZI|nr:hypothetical protein LTR62_008042 [Meristemomyces frigidus]
MSLPLLSAKHLPHGLASDANLVAYCDPHDLIAIATDSHDIVIYRITGQVAFTIKRKDDELKITALAWKDDGSVLAVAWSDGSYGLHSGESGKLVHRNSVRVEPDGERGWGLGLVAGFGGGGGEEDGEGVIVRSFGWMKHVGGGTNTASSEMTVREGSTEDWEAAFGDLTVRDDDDDWHTKRRTYEKGSIKSLARAIATMDVTTVLPKLSVIPSHGLRSGPDGSNFGTQALVETIFGSSKTGDADAVDILIVGSNDGTLRVLMDDTVEIGACHVLGVPELQASHPRSATHNILSSTTDIETILNSLNLPMETLSGSLLHEVSTNTKRLQHLLEYITTTVRCIGHDYTTGLIFPSRLIKNISLELQENKEGDLVTSLYHLAMTGQNCPTILEWFTDVVKETNHKRWDNAVVGMYTSIQNHLFFNLLPALNRLEIAVVMLRGLATFHSDSAVNVDRFIVDTRLLTHLLESADALRLVAQKLQLVVSAELKSFKAFSKWLKVYIDIAIAGHGSPAAAEIEDREQPNLVISDVLRYLEGAMVGGSKVEGFVAELEGWKGAVERQEWMVKMEELSYVRTREAVKAFDMESSKSIIHNPALLNLPALTVWTSGLARIVLGRITVWQSKLLKLPTSQSVAIQRPRKILDMAVTLASENDAGRGITNTLVMAGKRELQFVHGDLSSASLHYPDVIAVDEEILDAKILPSGGALLLARLVDGPVAIIAPDHKVVHEFADDFEPTKMIVGGRKGKRVCLVLGTETMSSGTKGWRIVDLAGLEA